MVKLVSRWAVNLEFMGRSHVEVPIFKITGISSVWSERGIWIAEAVGSNPAFPTILNEASDRARERRCLQNSCRWERYPQKPPIL